MSVFGGRPLRIDESALTGGELPVTKNPGDQIFSGSTCVQGEIEAVIIATGANTFFAGTGHRVKNTNQAEPFQKMILTVIGNFCICLIALGMMVEIIVMYPMQRCNYRDGIDNLLVLLTGGIPIVMPTVLSMMMAIGLCRLYEQGAIAKHRSAIDKMAGMDARADITEVHFLPFNPVDKQTAITCVDSDGNWHRVSKGAPKKIIDLCKVGEDVKKKVHDVIGKFADHNFRSLAVAKQAVPEKTKDSAGGPWQFVGLLPLLDPPRHNSAETIRQALNLGVDVKMITGDRQGDRSPPRNRD